MDLTASPLLSNSLAFKKMQFALRIAADSETSRIDLGRDLQTAARAAFSDASEYVEPAGGYDDSYQLRREQNRTTFRQTLKIFDEANSVALVGNGSVLKGSGLGKAIDSHDVVVRINWPAIKGYSDDVGSNTSLVLFVEQYMHGAINQDSLLKKMSQYNSSVPGLALDAGRTVSTVFPEFCGEPPSNICLMPAAARKCLKYLGYQYATTGLLSMLLISLILNKTVTIFGFDFYRDLNRQYYFGTTPPDPHLTHELQYEVWMVRQFFARILPDKLLMPGSV
ncbi:hypothetical protein CCR94_08735 [Rhodoblastus sphagnicola]|uniref:Uncharacterized protein n=2 Tax=Rhodoblastus sphagnicola TaxID=333368 RepID=A0A2S6N9W9_9HYPH|nr:hypothetical protein CCR94_08735 [Rhodoblastus sphagnicola]